MGDVIECRTAHYSQDDLKKRMNRRTNTWRNGCFGKINDLPVHISPNHHPPKMNVLSKKLFFKSSLPLNGYCSIQFRPPTSSDDLCLPLCRILILYSVCLAGNLGIMNLIVFLSKMNYLCQLIFFTISLWVRKNTTHNSSYLKFLLEMGVHQSLFRVVCSEITKINEKSTLRIWNKKQK